MGADEIQRLLPHRYPFLLIDRIVEFEPRKRIVAIKNVTANEPFFQGHFPGYPIMPGVLVLEAMAQAGALMILFEFPRSEDKLIFFTGVERARFRRPVLPGDQLRLEVDVLAWRSNAGKMDGRALIDGKLAVESVLSCHVADRK
jgi:3-hydroxyacyl-[acyl-carrier-protein] dehydratase